MRFCFITLAVALALFSIPVSAVTVDFNAYGAASGLGFGGAEWVGASSVAFSGFELSTADHYGLQLDAPGYYGATNYEITAEGPLAITFDLPQTGFSIDLRDFAGYGGSDTISVYATDGTTLLNTYTVSLDGAIRTFNDAGESAPIGVVVLSTIPSEGWTGILQSVTYGNTAIPEPATSALFGAGILALAAMFRRKR